MVIDALARLKFIAVLLSCSSLLLSLPHRYEKSDRRWKMGYEVDFIEYLESLVRDLDRRIKRGKERLQRSADAKQKAR